MVRILLLTSLWLLISFTGIGLALSREWGWSEYTSDELYVVYWGVADGDKAFFVVNTNEHSASEKLISDQGAITAINCSPDGRTLALIIDAAHLYVVNSAGLLYDRSIPGIYANLTVANNGTVAYFQNTTAFLVDAHHSEQLVRPGNSYSIDRSSYYNYVGVSSQGFELWSSPPDGVQLVSPAEKRVENVSLGTVMQSLASEQVFTYRFYPTTISTDTNSGRYLFDIPTQRSVWVGRLSAFTPLSPDGKMGAIARLAAGESGNRQILIVDPFDSTGTERQLTHDPDLALAPICFLTFRPEMLIDNSQ